jgi:hypothetical protein
MLLIVKVVNDVLEHAIETGCDEVRFESNDLELKIMYLFTGMCIEEISLPALYHDQLREAVAELEARDRGEAGPCEECGLGGLLNETSFRASVDEVGEMEIRVTFSTITSD